MGTMAMDVRETGTPVGRLARADQRGLLEDLDGTGVPSYRYE
jgi:hypothetical protein